MAKKCQAGFRRFKGHCVKKEDIGIHAPDVKKQVVGFTRAYSRGDYVGAKRWRMKIEKVAGKGAMPSYPSASELKCPEKLAREVACASNMISSGRAKGYQPNAICRKSVARTQCHYCKSLECKR